MENQETDSKSFTKFPKYAIKTEDLLLNTHNFNYFILKFKTSRDDLLNTRRSINRQNCITLFVLDCVIN